ncbi:MAG: prepilin-type N-terminal cleavage/methylation domain-containing protein [Candidatus Peregrinibacteria bacterium]
MRKTLFKGFTLIELIIVIAIIAILAAAIFVAIDPARRLNEARNARRASDVSTILDAVVKYQADNNGTHYSTVEGLTNGNYHVIGTCAAGANTTCGTQTTQAACVNLAGIGTSYLGSVPQDPRTGTAANTDYYLMKDSNGAITVGACDAEGEAAGGGGDAPVIKVIR